MTEKFIRQIAWEKWKDPYGENLDQIEWPGAFGNFETDEILNELEKQEQGEGDEEEEWNEDKYDKMDGKVKPSVSKKPIRPMKILATPAGLVPLTEWSSPSKIFDFWVIHSNFRMTDNIQDILDNTDGVETLDIFSPYRWRIAIGKAFDGNAVKQRVMKNLEAVPLELIGSKNE